ncbi:LOW QUALITY PROTEIN: hypothetical protein PHPALM_30586 [Phytophthora palmivora]|uniref:Uncharacterized protein n=1 Tax=Phytophthora palmivora TaxID=4796 RepID=A0A2P4X4S0_9STRA|nr:LOW QUALITY PROTEIN: hypothetical protein PHPALM_30586 [Phytophthora palmivora]
MVACGARRASVRLWLLPYPLHEYEEMFLLQDEVSQYQAQVKDAEDKLAIAFQLRIDVLPLSLTVTETLHSIRLENVAFSRQHALANAVIETRAKSMAQLGVRLKNADADAAVRMAKKHREQLEDCFVAYTAQMAKLRYYLLRSDNRDEGTVPACFQAYITVDDIDRYLLGLTPPRVTVKRPRSPCWVLFCDEASNSAHQAISAPPSAADNVEDESKDSPPVGPPPMHRRLRQHQTSVANPLPSSPSAETASEAGLEASVPSVEPSAATDSEELPESDEEADPVGVPSPTATSSVLDICSVAAPSEASQPASNPFSSPIVTPPRKDGRPIGESLGVM